MPRPRSPENKGLPKRWCFRHGAYFYQVPAGLEAAWDDKKYFRLGKTLPEAYRVWADRLGQLQQDQAHTIGQLLDRYALEVTPLKPGASRARESRMMHQLQKVFGDVPLTTLKPQHIYIYADKRARKSVNDSGKMTGGTAAAKHEIALLSHAYTKAVQWGYVEKHPFKGEVRLISAKPRTRYVEDWEIIECLQLPTERIKGSVLAIQAYIRLKLLTGLRGGDLLRIQEKDLREDGLHVMTSKTGRAVIYTWSDELRASVTAAKLARPNQNTTYLFCNKSGMSYFDEDKGMASGWHSMWQRFMTRVLAETKVSERFTEHDLRAKAASDAEDLERARQLLAHIDGRTTNRVYRRKPEKIAPVKLHLNKTKPAE